MAKGKCISEAMQWIVIRMGASMSQQDISMYVDISEHKVRDILACFKRTGEVKGPKLLTPKLHQLLCDYDIQVILVLPHIFGLSDDCCLAFVADPE